VVNARGVKKFVNKMLRGVNNILGVFSLLAPTYCVPRDKNVEGALERSKSKSHLVISLSTSRIS
jgi:hypothetical protein